MKVALVHDWLTGMRGGEKCLEVFCELFPDAELYTLIYRPEKVSPTIRKMNVRASWLNRLPAVERYYRYGLPLFPRSVEGFELEPYDLVLSSSHCVAKGARSAGGIHVSYVHAPMRYIWELHDAYFGRDGSWLATTGMSVFRSYLQRWDVRSAQRVDHFIANSKNVAAKIKKLYGRDAAVIYPPVELERFRISGKQEPFYLIVSALVPYKNIDVAIDAFNRLKVPLKIAGVGPLRKKLEKVAGSNIEFLGWVDDALLPRLYASCQAVIFPGEEDFGIVPLEAQASGRPVIAYGKGGVLESVIPFAPAGREGPAASPTGIFFGEPTSASLIRAVELYQKNSDVFDPAALRDQAAQFSRERFKLEIKAFLEARLRGSGMDK